MPDFRMQQNFPMAEVINAGQRKGQLENDLTLKQSEMFNQSLNAIGKMAESMYDKKKRVARAMLLAQQPDVADMLSGGDQMVTQGPHGPVRFDQTAQGGVDKKPVQNAGPLSPQNAAILLDDQDPLAVLKQAFERKNKLNPQMVEETIYKKDAFGNTIPTTRMVPKGSKFGLAGPTAPPRVSPAMSPDRAEFKIIDTFNANPQVRRQQQSIESAETIGELALSNNPIAAAAIPTYMARASGEVGALSEPDKKPFGGSQAILEKLEAALTQKVSGQLTEENRQFLIQLSEIMVKNAEANLDRKGREFSDQYSKTRVGLKAEDIFSSLRPNSQYKVEKSTAAVPPPTDPESKDVLKVGGSFNGQRIVGVKLKKS